MSEDKKVKKLILPPELEKPKWSEKEWRKRVVLTLIIGLCILFFPLWFFYNVTLLEYVQFYILIALPIVPAAFVGHVFEVLIEKLEVSKELQSRAFGIGFVLAWGFLLVLIQLLFFDS